MAVTITPVATSQHLDTFIRLPWRLYEGDKNWIPPLVSEERKMLDPAKNPVWDNAEGGHCLAEREGKVVGRISAILNRAHNEYTGEKTGFWGYFESEDDKEVAGALFDGAAVWHRERGMTRLLGPANPSLNDPCGMLIKGFKYAPFVMMPYNPEYYTALAEGAGFTKAMDLFAYILVANTLVRDRIDRVAEKLKERKEIHLREISLSRFAEELKTIREIYNDAWERNWGFVPMTDKEFQFAAEGMKQVLLPEYAYVAEHEGKAVGFALALPDINHVLKRCNGSIWPFGWFYFMKPALRKIPALRIVALGVLKTHQHMGIGTLFYQKFIEEGMKRGIKAGELSWVLETNDKMNRPIQEMGARPYKKYRLYERKIEPSGH